MIDQIFKQLKDSNTNVITKTVSGWPFPEKRKNPNELTEFVLSENQNSLISKYLYKVYDGTKKISSSDKAKTSQFTLTYGNRDEVKEHRAIYNQYVNSILLDKEEGFGFDKKHFYAINLNRRTFHKEVAQFIVKLKLSPDGVELTISPENLGKREVPLTVEDGSKCGYIYPKEGIAILNPDFLVSRAENPDFIEPNLQSKNHKKLFKAIKRGGSFVLQGKKQAVKNTYTIEFNADEFNYSLNPTYRDEQGQIDTYFTGIGFYNDEYQLLAVAKLEEPMKKTAASIDIEIEH